MAETHVELAGSRRPAPRNAVRVKAVDPQAHIEVTVTLKAPPLPALTAMPSETLSRAQIDEKWGVPAQTVQKVEAVLRSYGLEIRGANQGGRSMRVAGTVAAMESAFQPHLALYNLPGVGEIRGRSGALMLPRELDGLITGVNGFDQRPVAKRHSRAMAAAVPALGPALKPLKPADLRARYNFPKGDGAGSVIAIAEFGVPLPDGQSLFPAYIPADVRDFCLAHDLPVPNVRVESVNFTPLTQAEYNAYLKSQPLDSANKVFGLTAEAMMDTQIIASLCPGADIGVYFASWDQKGWIDLLDEVTSGHPPVTLSISYGLPEEATDWTDNAMASINHRLQIAAMMGITVCVSSGDDGSGCGMSGSGAHVAFPGSSPFVLSVGGTMLAPSAGGFDEVVWWQTPGRRTDEGFSGATGGGVSNLNERPPWQTIDIPSVNTDPKPISKGRIVPDVAALAGPPLYDLILNGEWSPGGGTSASAPCWAALVACINQELPAAKRQRFLPPLLYKVAMAKTGFRDIVSGNNASHPDPGKGYAAGPGFDAVSGWGVPNGTALVAALGTV